MAVVATGFFDGVHLGHRRVIETLVNAARQRGGESIVVTFWPHPRTVLQNDARTLRLLTSLSEKTALLKGLGVDRVEVLDFSRELRSLTAEQYIRDVLKDRFGADAIVLGYDHRFGSDALPHDKIGPLARSFGLDVFDCAAETSVPGEAISSTRIRKALEAGDAVAASAMLGRPYSLHGVVVSGNQLGRTIGYPTANMQLYEPLKLIPGRGVYLVEVDTLDASYYGMTNIGCRPTVSTSSGLTIETHIFDFDAFIYGLDIRIRFLEKIRDERRFDSVEALRSQLASDEAVCRGMLTSRD